jgi:1,4-alpha-glucan branching enzyme
MNTLVPVMFRFPAGLVPGAQRVAVVGPFNGWNHMAHAMSRRAGGDWTMTIYLPPGRLVYLFAVDGEFWLDPDDEERMPNSWGSEYSVRYIGATPADAKDVEIAGPRKT